MAAPGQRFWQARLAFVVSALLTMGYPRHVFAQATIPSPGAAALSLTYEYFDGGDHLFPTDAIDGLSTRGYVADGSRWFLGDTWAHTVLGSVDLGVHPRLAVTIGAAVVSSAYDGEAPVNLEIDDGQFRTSLQDAMIRARSPFRAGSFLLTPFVGVAVPLREYAESGHSAPGRGLIEVQGGIHALRGIGPYASIGLVSADIGYGWVTNVSETDLGRLTVAAEFAYSQSRRLVFSVAGRHLETFGGYEWASDDPAAPPGHGSGDQATLHLQASAARATMVGLGLDWGVTDRIVLGADVYTTVWGENVDDATLFSAGMSWAFRVFGAAEAEAR